MGTPPKRLKAGGSHPVLPGMDDPNLPARQAPQWPLDMLEESRADVAAGRTSPWPEARARLVALIEQLEAERARKQA